MKRFLSACLAVLASLVLTFNISQASASAIGDARQCLQDIVDHPEAHTPRSKCLELSLPIEKTEGLSGRAIYLSALSYAQNFSPDPKTFEDGSKILNEYFQQHLEQALKSSMLPSIPSETLRDVWNTINHILFYSAIVSEDEFGLQIASDLFAELQRRGEALLTDARDMLELYEKHSRWDKALTLANDWPALGSVVETSGSIQTNELGYYTISADLKKMSLKPATTDTGPQIIIFGDCHFAFDAFETLASFSEFNSVMNKHGLVIGAPYHFDLQQISDLRTKYPAFEIHPLYKWGSWFQKGINVIASPSFAFLVDGQVKFRIPGLSEHLTADFCAGLQSIGISAHEACTR